MSKEGLSLTGADLEEERYQSSGYRAQVLSVLDVCDGLLSYPAACAVQPSAGRRDAYMP